MRFIPTHIHGVLDYLMGVLLIGSPWIVGFHDHNTATAIPLILGILVILYSLTTNYEAGAIRRIPMPVHLWLDGVSGAFLAASPWIFGFADYVWLPHLAFGLIEIGAAVCTQTQPSRHALGQQTPAAR